MVDYAIFKKIVTEINVEIASLKRANEYTKLSFIEIRNNVLHRNLGWNNPDYDDYKSAVSSHFGKIGGHVAASRKRKKVKIYSARENKILRDLEKDELMEGARQNEMSLLSHSH